MNRLLIVSICVLFLCGCPARITKIEDISPKEAAIIAKLKVLYNGEDVTKNSGIILDVPSVSIPMYKFRPDENGYIYGRVPLGNISIRSLDILSGFGRSNLFKADELTFKLDRGQAIFYLGDITFDWKGDENRSLAIKKNVTVSVESDIAKAEEIFRKKFPHNFETLTSVLVVKPTLESNKAEIAKLNSNWLKVRIGMSFQQIDELINILVSTDSFVLRGENRLYKLNNSHVLVFQDGYLVEIK